MAFSRLLVAFLEAGGALGFVILLELGPKERVFWERAVGLEGLRRVGGMIATGSAIRLGGGCGLWERFCIEMVWE